MPQWINRIWWKIKPPLRRIKWFLRRIPCWFRGHSWLHGNTTIGPWLERTPVKIRWCQQCFRQQYLTEVYLPGGIVDGYWDEFTNDEAPEVKQALHICERNKETMRLDKWKSMQMP